MKLPTLSEQIIIEEILAEASTFSLRYEVRDLAEKIWSKRKQEEDFTLLDAYHLAYNECIK